MRNVIAIVCVLFAFIGTAEARTHHHRHHYGVIYDQGSMVSHPSGCPGRLFCGCGASVRVFGHPVRELFIASAWFKFPRAAPASGMAAVRSHHVFVLESPTQNPNVWMVYDANSGGHGTRLHLRQLAGYVIVNPRG